MYPVEILLNPNPSFVELCRQAVSKSDGINVVSLSVGKDNSGMKSMGMREPSKKVRFYECLQVIMKALLRCREQ